MADIAELISRVAEGGELSAEERAQLAEFKLPGSENKAAAAARVRMTEQTKQLEKLQVQLEEQTLELEEAKAGGSKAEQAARKLERLEAKQAEVMSALEKERAEHATTRRANALGGLEIPWMDGVSGKYKQSVLEEVFDGVDTDDLGDKDFVSAKVQQLIKEQSAFVKAPVKPGAGTGADQSLNGALRTESTDWTRPVDWKALQETGGSEAVIKKLDQMWAEPPALKQG